MMRVCGASVAIVLWTSGVMAADYAAPAPVAAATEARLGIFAHDPLSVERGAANVNAELIISPFGRDLASAWGWLTPRVHLGGTVNTNGGTSAAYAGFTWTKDLTSALFVEAALGGAVHNGSTGFEPSPGRIAMGCRFAFHEAASIGLRVSPAWSVMATVEHFSNAGVCERNRGLTNLGVRVGYTF